MFKIERFTSDDPRFTSDTKAGTNHLTLKAMEEAFNMTKQRCYNESQKDYRYYGGRGIKICDRWLQSFDNFVADMGLRPEGYTLERVENDKDYSPENCVWASRLEQSGNTSRSLKLTFEGQTKSLEEWSKITGIAYGTLKARMQRLGYTPEQVLSKPVKFGATVKGRVYLPRKKPDMSKVPKGFDDPRAKVTKELALEIQAKYDNGGETFSSLSRQYKLSIETCSNICQRQRHFNITE